MKLQPKTIFIYKNKQRQGKKGETDPTTTVATTTITTGIFGFNKP